MQLLRTNTATRITVGPFFDKTDGVTPEVAITVTADKLTFIIDTGGVPTLILDTAPTASGGANDMVHITGDDAGYYDLELAAADVNYLGRAKLALTDATVHCPVFHEYMIIPAMVYDALVLGTDTLQADTVQWLGTACATPTTNGVPEVDVTHVAGTAQTAGDLAALITAVDDLVDTEVGAIKTKTDFLPSVTAGAAGGLMIAGSNAATTFATLTVTGATTFTGNVAYSNGITITQATLNGHGISITGNGTGSGVNSVGGATGMGGNFQGGSTSGIGLRCYSTGAATTYSGFHAEATATNGSGMRLVGAGTGSALLLEPGVSGYGVNGSIQGDLSGSVGSVTGAVGSVTGDVGGNVVGSLGSLVANAINNNSIHSNACAKISDSGIQRGASNWENNSDDRSLAWAISKLVNKVDLNAAGDTLSIRKSNDSTALFTQAVTTSGGASPITALDTA